MRALLTIAALGAAVSTAAALTAPKSAVNLTGTWKYAVVTENGTGTPTVIMKQTGDSLSGTYESGRMGVLPFKGSVKDAAFTFAIATQGGATLTFKGTIVSENVVKGDVDFGGQGGATFSGERQVTK
ncbi:MAG: hypothetical protein IBJ03_03145 [Gemmatimonadaceae bacterium]|nr:hypothetical protein [Gemmatimonadaceae bacterium]